MTADVGFIQALAGCEQYDHDECIERGLREDDSLNVRAKRRKPRATDRSNRIRAQSAPAHYAAAAPAARQPQPLAAEASDPAGPPRCVVSLDGGVWSVYIAAEPGAPSLILCRDSFRKGRHAADSFEAMKTMNHIPAPRSRTGLKRCVGSMTALAVGIWRALGGCLE